MESNRHFIAFRATEDLKKQLQTSARVNNRSLGKQALHYVLQGMQIEAMQRASKEEGGINEPRTNQ